MKAVGTDLNRELVHSLCILTSQLPSFPHFIHACIRYLVAVMRRHYANTLRINSTEYKDPHTQTHTHTQTRAKLESQCRFEHIEQIFLSNQQTHHGIKRYP